MVKVNLHHLIFKSKLYFIQNRLKAQSPTKVKAGTVVFADIYRIRCPLRESIANVHKIIAVNLI